MLIGPSGQTGGGSQPVGSPGVQSTWNQLQWDLRYNWPSRQQRQAYLAQLFGQIPASK
jgi:hypothetical protein